jgi:hypothetical protein
MKSIPIACTLEPDAIKARQEGLLAELLRRAEAHDATDDGHRLRFCADDGILETIARVVDAERRCCRFLQFRITVEPDGGPIWLDLTGPPGTREYLTALLDP